MLTFYSAINFIAALVMFTFSAFLYQGSTQKNIRAYTFYTASTASWALAIAVYLFLTKENYDLALLVVRFLYTTGITTGVGFYYFTVVHNDDATNHSKLRRTLSILTLVQIFGYIFTSALVKGITFVPDKIYHRIPIYNWPGFMVYNIAFTIIVGAAFWNLWKKWRSTTNPDLRAQTRLLFLAGLIAWWPPVIMGILLPLIGNFDYYWIAPTTTALWVIFTSYAIFRKNLFKVRVILPAILIVILLMILFVNIFVPDLGNLFGSYENSSALPLPISQTK
jgi:hypothetical protein